MTRGEERNGEWRAVLDASASLEQETAALAKGGFITVQGAPAAIETWAESAAAAAGARLLRLDLEGWEPERSERRDFLRYRAAVAGEEAPAAEMEEATDERADGPLGLFAAAGLALFGVASPRGRQKSSDRESFVAELCAASSGGAKPLVVVVADGDVSPQPLRHALAEAVRRADGDLAVIDGTRGRRPAGSRIEPRIEPLEDPRLEAINDAHARRVLEALAILGRPFPLEPLLELLVQERDLHEEVIDLVDDLLDDELELVEDLGFVHPLFDESVYRVRDPLFAARLLAAVDVEPRAEALLSYLRQRLEPRARTTSLALARLADLAGRDEQARRLELRLRWWVPAGEIDEALADSLEKEQIDDAELLRLGGDGVLGPEIRLAVIAAHEEAGPSPELEGRLRLHRARALRDAGRLEEALEAVAESLDWQRLNRRKLAEAEVGEHVELFLETQLTAARLLAAAGEARAARDQLLQARQLAAEVLDPDDPRHAVLAAELGRALMAVGEMRAARAPLEEACERAEKRFGEAHPQSVSARNNLAALLIDIGELESAQAHLVRALQSARQARLPLPLRLGLWNNLQTASSRLGESEQIDRLLAVLRPQIAGGPSEVGLFAPLAGRVAADVPVAALGELEHMLGLGAALEIDDFEIAEARLLDTLARELED